VDEFELVEAKDFSIINSENRTLDSLVKETLEKISIMNNPPTSIVCDSDSKALAFLKYAHAFGISVPNDLSIIGFNNSHFSEHASPSLTSVNQPMEEMGQSAINFLIERIGHPHIPNRELRYALNIIKRDSVREII
jgi:DNA-binding LacI/PurR family transcriptional regulator